MASTVIQAFNEFMKDTVNLDSEITKGAISSRDWLINQIANFKSKESDFPTPYGEINISFGSIKKKTKTDMDGAKLPEKYTDYTIENFKWNPSNQ